MKRKKILKLLITVILMCFMVTSLTAYAANKQVCPTCWEADNTVENTGIQKVGQGQTERWVCDKGHTFTTPKTITDGTGTGGETEATEDGGFEFLKSMLTTVFGSAFSVSEDGSGSLLDPWTMLKNSTEVVLKTLNDMVGSTLYAVFKALGIILLTIYFIMDLATHDIFTAFGNKPTIEQFLKPFMKYLLCVLFVCNVQWVLYFLLGLSQGAYVQSMNTLTIENVNMSVDVVDKIIAGSGYVTETPNFMEGLANTGRVIMMFLSFMLPWFVSTICNFMLVYVILSRIVQITVQGIIAPISMSDIYTTEGKFRETRAWGFIRNFAGLCFQSVVIVLILYVVNSLIGTYVTQLTEGIGSTVGIGDMLQLGMQMSILKVVQVGTVFGSAAEAKKLFGA